jgi:hypothetical protein
MAGMDQILEFFNYTPIVKPVQAVYESVETWIKPIQVDG